MFSQKITLLSNYRNSHKSIVVPANASRFLKVRERGSSTPSTVLSSLLEGVRLAGVTRVLWNYPDMYMLVYK